MSAVPDNSARIARMRLLLEQAFAPSTLEIRDDSHLHAGHAGAASGAGHFHPVSYTHLTLPTKA